MALLGLALGLTLACPRAGAQVEPSPEATAAKARPRSALPRCDELGVTSDQIREAFRKIGEREDARPRFTDVFDEIGDELGCRWPQPGDRRRSSGVPFYERSFGGMQERR